MKTKEDLKSLIDHLSDEQVDLIYKLVSTCGQKFVTKNELLKLTGLNEDKIDTAIPIDYVRRIEEVLPGFKTYFHAYDYNKKEIYGEMLNIPEAVVENLIKTLK